MYRLVIDRLLPVITLGVIACLGTSFVVRLAIRGEAGSDRSIHFVDLMHPFPWFAGTFGRE
ncbi:MAG: hypothetical protein GEV13_23715 [Rhodospirillales bacterium]|nr:hypothetical protein [Rhodospirillales bacterium]